MRWLMQELAGRSGQRAATAARPAGLAPGPAGQLQLCSAAAADACPSAHLLSQREEGHGGGHDGGIRQQEALQGCRVSRETRRLSPAAGTKYCMLSKQDAPPGWLPLSRQQLSSRWLQQPKQAVLPNQPNCASSPHQAAWLAWGAYAQIPRSPTVTSSWEPKLAASCWRERAVHW